MLNYRFVIDWLTYYYFYSFYKCIGNDKEGSKELKTPPIFEVSVTEGIYLDFFLP